MLKLRDLLVELLLNKIVLRNPCVFGVVRFGYRIGLNPKLISKFQKDQT